jgi:hypothetical protein
MPRRLRAQEKVPVLGSDERTVAGSCAVRKFARAVGKPFKEVTVLDPHDRPVARILVYRLHSLIACDDLEVDAPPIQSKDAARVARAGLEALPGDAAAVLRAMTAEAEACVREREAEREREQE